MATIKMFTGTPPSLKNGEWASDGQFAYLGTENSQYKVFQGIFDLSKSQEISGFEYSVDKKAILIPAGTPFSELQELFDALPKSLKYDNAEKVSMDILFEDGTYVNDLGESLVLRDFSYQINILSSSDTIDETIGTFDKSVVFQSEKAITIYNCPVNFSDIRFEYSDSENGAIAFLNCSTMIDDCCFDAKVEQACVTDNGYNKIVFSDSYFRMNRDAEDSILTKAAVGSSINIARSKSDPEYRPKTIATTLSGGIIVVGNIEDLSILEKSPLDSALGGIEVHGGFVTDVDGNLDVNLATRLSEFENDEGFTGDFEELENKPTTITVEQAVAIEANSKKISYPEDDAEKLSKIQENATAGATAEQAAAIEANSKKISYPEEDAEKLSNIQENATAGATAEQAAAIEANTTSITDNRISALGYDSSTNVLTISFGNGSKMTCSIPTPS